MRFILDVRPCPFPAHCRSGQSSESRPVRVCDGQARGRATDRVEGVPGVSDVEGGGVGWSD